MVKYSGTFSLKALAVEVLGTLRLSQSMGIDMGLPELVNLFAPNQ